MKLSPHAFSRFWDVHAWAGVLGGLLLYLMCFAGAITLFHEQLRVWEEPLAQRAATSQSLHAVLEHGLAAAGPIGGESWFAPPGERGLGQLSYQAPGDPEWKHAWIDVERGALVPERVRLTSFLYSLHFFWHDLTGDVPYYFAGLLAVALFLAIVTGVLIHLKDLVRQVHQFRPDKSRRVLWSDMHKVLGVMGLPFQLMYAYTGAFIVLGSLVLPTFRGPVFGGDERKAEELAWSLPPRGPTQAGALAPTLSADELFARARAAVPGITIQSVKLIHHGRENGIFEIRGKSTHSPPGRVTLQLREVDGQVLNVTPSKHEGASAATQRWILALHFASFGGLFLRFAFFVLALALCVTILTGNWIWLARRESARASAGNRLLARLTTGFGVGVPLSVAFMFLVSRLLPLDWAGRGRAEEVTFLAALSLCIVGALLVRDQVAVWWRGLIASGLVLLPVPILATRWSDAGLFGWGDAIDTVVGVDVALLAISVAFVASGIALRAARARDRQPAPIPEAHRARVTNWRCMQTLNTFISALGH